MESDQDRSFDSIDVEFEPVAPVTVPDEIRLDDNEYFYECLSLLNRFTSGSQSSDLDLPSSVDENEFPKHFVLFSFIALSLVINADRDVAAVAIYHFKEKVEVYYAKNWVRRPQDVKHAEEFAQIVRKTAARNDTRETFQDQYFSLILRNAKPKFMKRFTNFKDAILQTIHDPRVLPPYADDLMKILQDLCDAKTPSVIRNNADKEAASLSNIRSIHVGLVNALKACKSAVTAPQSMYDYMRVSAFAYIIGSSSVIQDVVKQRPTLKTFLHRVQQFGIYYRGTVRLYSEITANANCRKMYSSFELIGIDPPEDLRRSMEKDWWKVLNVVYYRHTNRVIPITRGQFNGRYSSAVRDYEKYKSQQFEQHCEITLLRHLSVSRGPAELGISKACCPMCFEFINGVNAFRERMGLSLWMLGRRHSQIYNWRCEYTGANGERDISLEAGAEATRQLVREQIVRLVRTCRIKKLVQSPAYQSDPEINEPETISRFLSDMFLPN